MSVCAGDFSVLVCVCVCVCTPGPVHLGVVDLTKAYDLVDHSTLFAMLKHYRVPQ